MEQANTPPPAAEHPKPPGKKKIRPWLIGCVADLALFLFLLCIAVILIAILAPVFSKATNTTNADQAKSTLRKAVNAVEQYPTDIDGFYTTMTADKLSTINADIRWVDGDPEPGEVGIRNLGEYTYTLTYKNQRGEKYLAEKKDNGEILYLEQAELPLP